MAWSISRPSNPMVLVLNTTVELTRETIQTSPPSSPPRPLDRLFEVPGIRSIDLHRYRARLNLAPGADRDLIITQVCELLSSEWGSTSSQKDEPTRTFDVSYAGPRLVAESLGMAGSQPILRALLGICGVAEAILEPGQVSVRLGRLFSWAQVEDDVRKDLVRFVSSSTS